MLNVALELFSRDGYENVGVQKIVVESGVKKPTLYHYFGSKQGLLLSLIETLFNPFLAELRELALYNGDIVMSLKTVVKHYFKFARLNPKFYRLFLSLIYSSIESEARKTITPFLDEQLIMIEKLFLEAEDDHGNMRGRSKLYSTTYLGMINSHITMSLYSGLELDDELVFRASHQFMHGIFS